MLRRIQQPRCEYEGYEKSPKQADGKPRMNRLTSAVHSWLPCEYQLQRIKEGDINKVLILKESNNFNYCSGCATFNS